MRRYKNTNHFFINNTNIIEVYLDLMVTMKCIKYKGLFNDKNHKLYNIGTEA